MNACNKDFLISFPHTHTSAYHSPTRARQTLLVLVSCCLVHTHHVVSATRDSTGQGGLEVQQAANSVAPVRLEKVRNPLVPFVSATMDLFVEPRPITLGRLVNHRICQLERLLQGIVHPLQVAYEHAAAGRMVAEV